MRYILWTSCLAMLVMFMILPSLADYACPFYVNTLIEPNTCNVVVKRKLPHQIVPVVDERFDLGKLLQTKSGYDEAFILRFKEDVPFYTVHVECHKGYDVWPRDAFIVSKEICTNATIGGQFIIKIYDKARELFYRQQQNNMRQSESLQSVGGIITKPVVALGHWFSRQNDRLRSWIFGGAVLGSHHNSPQASSRDLITHQVSLRDPGVITTTPTNAELQVDSIHPAQTPSEGYTPLYIPTSNNGKPTDVHQVKINKNTLPGTSSPSPVHTRSPYRSSQGPMIEEWLLNNNGDVPVPPAIYGDDIVGFVPHKNGNSHIPSSAYEIAGPPRDNPTVLSPNVNTMETLPASASTTVPSLTTVGGSGTPMATTQPSVLSTPTERVYVIDAKQADKKPYLRRFIQIASFVLLFFVTFQVLRQGSVWGRIRHIMRSILAKAI